MAFPPRSPQNLPFTEKAFYLGEFRGRTIGVAAPARELPDPAVLLPALGELEANPTPALVLTDDPAVLDALPDTPRVDVPEGRLEGSVWRRLCETPRIGLVVADEAGFEATCRKVAVRLRLSKLVFVSRAGGLARPDRSRLSLVDLGDLAALVRDMEGDGRGGLLREIEAALRGGVPAVNLCSAEGFGDELFTYAGSGTLFTRERYVEVRPLGIDDFSAADDLVTRGVSEGYLAARRPAELDRVFANGMGAFVEGRHLAGIGALLPHLESNSGEIVSLYTLTRFLGEGIGGHLVAALCEQAQRRGHRFVFACTTTERVAGFFARQGFDRVGVQDIPDEKWRHYDARRRPRVRCLRREL